MEAQQTANVIKIRPAEMELAQPSFQPSVQSIPSNIYIQEIQAQSYSADRMSWSFRSPSANLLCSPYVEGVFRVKIVTPHKLSKAEGIGPLLGSYSNNSAAGAAVAPALGAVGGNYNLANGYGYRQLLSFGSGNAVMNAVESTSITVNGATWSTLNQNLYQRSLDKCFVPDDVAQRAWSTCGGCFNAFDQTPVSGHVLGLSSQIRYAARAGGGNRGRAVEIDEQNAAGDALLNGYCPTESSTMDSGLTQRMHNFYEQMYKAPTATATLFTYYLEVKFPIDGCIFNGLWGASGLARSDPRLRMALGLPHVNQGVITLQFRSLLKTLIRRLGRPTAFGANNARATVVSAIGNDMDITFDSSYAPRLRFTYIRLPSYRAYPQTAALQIYRREVRRPQGTETDDSYGAFAYGLGVCGPRVRKGLQCGADFGHAAATLNGSVGIVALNDGMCKEVVWTGIQFPQVPNHIFIVYSKDAEIMVHHTVVADAANVSALNTLGANYQLAGAVNTAFADVAGANAAVARFNNTVTAPRLEGLKVAMRGLAQCRDTNASIVAIEIVVQSAVGSFAFRDSSYDSSAHLQDRDLLWRKHSRNCHADYMKQGRGFWADFESCALLSCSDFLLGISTSYGTVFPITLDVRVKFANKSIFSGGACFTDGRIKGKLQIADVIVGTPTLVGCFNQNIMSIAASSAVISSQAFSQATTASALASS